MMRHIDVEGSYNVRDLGGYPTADGRVTRWRVLVRAGSLDRVTPAGQQQLLNYGVKTVIDLREVWEVREFQNVFAQSSEMSYLHLPLAPDGFVTNADYTLLEELYSQYLSTCQSNIAAVISAIIESPPGTIFHCFAGKDRTGIMTALLLGAVGVPDEVIIEDYAQTSQRIEHLIEQWREFALQHQ